MGRITALQLIEKRKALWVADSTKDKGYIAAVSDRILEDEDLLAEIVNNPELLIEMCFSIVNKDKKVMPFFLNPVQRDFCDRLNKAITDYMLGIIHSIKFLVLKGRQAGFTAFITAYQLACTITRKNFEGFTAADEEGNTAAIFENKAKHILSMLPDKIKPTEKYNNRRQLLFEKLHSSWEIKTASRNMGRSRTINFFHGCIHGDSLVIMSDNTAKPMKDICIGDEVITSSGIYSKVVNKWDVGVKQTFEVKTWLTNQSVKMTAEHKVLTLDGYKKCEELTNKDWIRVPTKRFTGTMPSYSYQKARTRSHIYPKREIVIDYNFGYFLGYYLAEGCVDRNVTKVEFASHRDEKYIATAHKAIKDISDYRTVFVAESLRAKHTYDSRELADIVLSICGRTEGKKLPDWVYKTNIYFAQGLIAGYFAGDGSKTAEIWSRTRATSVVEKISRGMRLLIASVYEVVPSLHYKTGIKRYGVPVKSAFILGVHGDCAELIQKQIDVDCSNGRRTWISKFKNINGKLYVRIKSVEPADAANVYDIEVANKDHNFLTPVGIVSNSEASFWRDGISGTQAGIGEALTKDAIQILESTANGYNEYKDLWDSEEWENCFYEWWRTEEYRLTFEDEDFRIEFIRIVNSGADWIHERCKWLLNDIKLDAEQVYWYYKKYRGYINKELIKQEYPCSVDEAFLASGSCIFNKERIIQRKTYLQELYKQKPPQTGEFIITWNDPDRLDYPIAYEWTNNSNGVIKIYVPPQSGRPYTVGGDTKGEGSDWFAATVKDNNSGSRVASLHMEGLKSKPYAAQVWALASYYNTALIGIEINWNTYPVELLTDWMYPRQYVREKTDTFTGELKKTYGWKTDGNTRPLIIERAITNVEESIENYNDIETLNEMLTFIKDKDGRYDAESSKHDDLLFSDMIADAIGTQQAHTVEEPPDTDEDDDEEDYPDLNSFFDC